MVRRLTWFTLGMAAGMGATAWIAARVTRFEAGARARLGRAAAQTVADALDSAAARLQNRPPARPGH